MQFSSATLYDESIDVADAEEVESPTSSSIKDRDLYSFRDKKTDYDNKVCRQAVWHIAACFIFAESDAIYPFHIEHLFVAHVGLGNLNGYHPCFIPFITKTFKIENLHLTLSLLVEKQSAFMKGLNSRRI